MENGHEKSGIFVKGRSFFQKFKKAITLGKQIKEIHNTSDKSISLMPLSPNTKLSDEHYKVYENYLEDALDEESVHNIAITGKYGSGKSSIIDSFFKDRDDWLKVSFATFDSNVEKKDNTEANKDNTGVIFVNIINQIIYQIDIKKIPLTRFKIKRPISRFSKSMLILEALLLASFFMNFSKNLPTINLFGWNILATDILYFRSFSVIVIGALTAWRILSQIEINRFKLSFKQFETEIDMKKDDLFEKYTDEVIYLFEKSEKSILIIEDLDRFKDLSIFEKLRELNIKLNQKSSKNWRFIYLIKDDLFNNKNDRVKFFDEIIPVIPFITTNNSFDKLRELFKGITINPRLLRILSVYIDDYRLLVNIRNEYKVYSRVISDNDKDELLALIAYKNIFPSRFDNLQNGKGELAGLVDNFRSNIATQLNTLNEKAKDLRNRKNNTQLSNEIEYLFIWAKRKEMYYEENSNGYVRRGLQIDSLHIAENIINSNLGIGYRTGGYIEYAKFKEENAEYTDDLLPVTGYDAELSRITGEIKKLNKYHFSDITREDSNVQNGMLFALIKNKFITLNYLNVINHYYGDTATLTFMKNILAESDDFDVNMIIHDHEGLFNQLEDNDYLKPQILNISFIRWLLDRDIRKFNVSIKTAYKNKAGFIENLLNENYEPDMYDAIKDLIPRIKFDLTILNQSYINNDDSIIMDNMYENNLSNLEILIQWLSEIGEYKEIKYLQILNSKTVYENLKLKLIRHETAGFVFSDIKEVTSINYWTRIVEFKHVKATNHNVNAYVSEFGLDEHLIKFINEAQLVANEKLSNEFYEKVLQNADKIPDIVFERIWNAYNDDKLPSEQIESLSKSKANILVKLNKVSVDAALIRCIGKQDLIIPEYINTEKVKQMVAKEHVAINRSLLMFFLDKRNSLNHEIFADNLSMLSREQIKGYIERTATENDKLLKILKGTRGYSNIKLNSNYVNKKILEWLKVNDEIKSITDENGKLSFTV